ncbi:Inositol-polyphosphate 4-phosphatase [Plasmopara halstedii]|uniref:Inositol-polyphosphate 4-phosphatase n=1 Tax=Plasmopara halstedii TaxID=4781 RepID=A0A0P1AU64_PLAHL|nr:Inositol-polyphosphate 4-phosphatase [Plasmopara halstedii]CEG44396.1 Inositol-polyphosphate 4-phosphatase [Plasmopara halstedii]|eukprot:XP_024580765.1 Inositol-polyphosphate 4-phosphatase [Plasmopara halstedii]
MPSGPSLRSSKGLLLVIASLFVTEAAFPETFAYKCEQNKCLYTTDTTGTVYTDPVDCVKNCRRSNLRNVDEGSELSDAASIHVSSSLNGTCSNCSLVVQSQYNFPQLLGTFDLTPESVASSSCNFTCEINLDTPSLWVLEGSSSDCFAGTEDTSVECSRDGNATIMAIDVDALVDLMRVHNNYKFIVDQVTTRLGPGTFSEALTLSVKFDGTGCLASSSNGQQAFQLELTSEAYELIGMFTNTEIVAENPIIMSSTPVTIRVTSGAVLSAGAFFLLRVASDKEEQFGTMIDNVTTASMLLPDSGISSPIDLELYVGASNISFTIPDSFSGSIQNGDTVNIMFKMLDNPENSTYAIDKVYLSAYQGLASAVDNSPIRFYALNDASRSLKAAPLDIMTVVVYGACFLFSLVIIRWHGLPLTVSTLWTDLVAITALFSFAAATGGYLVWVIQPSKAYVHWYTAQYFFNNAMILSLCFHWATVLSFKWFKKLSFTSPVVLAYILINACVLAFVVVVTVTSAEKLECVYDMESTACSSEEECALSIAAEGKIIRSAIGECDMETFYLAFGMGFIVYTLMLMVLGCMVMSRGRTLMLNEDPSDARIRKSLTIFYIIIATTCVFYVSAQVIYIAQYVSHKGEEHQLSDEVWYIFVVWLPHSLPPLLLLFLQWNPSTENYRHEDAPSLDQSSKEDVFNYTPRSSGSSSHMPYSKLLRDRLSMGDSLLNNDEPGSRLRIIVRLKLPASFDRACFVSLDFYSSKETITSSNTLNSISNAAAWKCIGTTEPVGVAGETESVLTTGSTHAIFPFVAVLEVPVIGPASNTLLRFMVHASTIGKRETSATYLDHSTSSPLSQDSSTNPQMSFQMTMFHPVLEFVTSSQAVLDAAASGHSLNIYPSDDHTCAILEEFPSLQSEINNILMGNVKNAELSVQTVMMPGDTSNRDDAASHKNIGNIIRFFQYDTEDGGGGLVVEDLQESVYSNAIPRQLMELIAAERQEQADRAREDLHSFLHQKKGKQNLGFYGTLIGQIQDDTDSSLAREWLEDRVRRRKEYVAMLRRNIQYLVNRDKHKNYFKASVEKKSADLRFVPINMHIQDLLIGPTNAFINDERRRSSKEVSAYDFTTVGAPAAHVYKFNKGGILSYQNRRKKMEAKIADADLDLSKWPEEIREYDDLKWDLQLRMDCAFAQALAALTCSFVRKVEVAIQNPDAIRGEDMLRQISSLGFLFQVESLLSTHGKEIGMLEDMAGSVEHLSCVAFVIQDVRDKPLNRFSFRMSRRKDVADEAGIVKVTVSNKTGVKRSHIKYIVTVQVTTSDVELPERLAAGGEIHVTPVLFSQGINEMQTIANNTERAKTELQDIINFRSLKPLKAFCEKYRRLIVAMPNSGANGLSSGRSRVGSHRYKAMSTDSTLACPLHLTQDEVTQELRALETCINEAAQSLVKTKRTEILKRSSDLCRELGGGRVTVCKSAKDRTAMSVTLEQVRILQRHHDLPAHRVPATVSVMRSHGVRIENALKNTGKRQFAFNKLQRSLLPEEYRCPDQVGGTGNVS